jgi:hypothetical protein
VKSQRQSTDFPYSYFKQTIPLVTSYKVTCLSLGPINSLPFFAYFLCLAILSEMVTFWLCMGLVIEMQFPALREFGTSGKPIWGTCAGLIFLADKAVGKYVASA